MNRRLKVIAVLAVAATSVAVAAFAVVSRVTHQAITITTHFQDAVGLYAGNGVAVLGMPVGKVTSIVSKDTYVEVKLTIEKAIDIPADVQAVTVSNSILTDRHVELTPPYHGGPKLKNGDVVGLGRTRTPVEFDRTLAMLDKLGTAMHGNEHGQGPLGDLVNLGADITSANGPAIKAALDQLSQALAVGADKGARSKKNIQEIIDSVAQLTQAAADNDTTIREFGSNLHQLSDILAEEDLGSGTTGAKANQLLAEAARLLGANREGLQHTFADSRTIATSLTDSRRELEETLDVLPLGLDNIYDLIDPVAGSARVNMLADKLIFDSQFSKEICNLMGLKQLGCATGTLQDYGPDFGLTSMLDLMANGIGSGR
ncbi:MCE family protein [Mycobacterium sp. pUA109]|uniref:MCE family protein n=1 Tax=Mycobacterium sp. pUA109 TaxID=3238982 RepID=UPI00351BB72D